MTYLQGDIVLLPFPFGDGVETKYRPAIIISNPKVNKTKDVIVAQITSSIKNDEFSFMLHDKIVTYPLKRDCEIRCHKLFTAEKSIITKKISTLKADQRENLYKKVISFLDL